MTSIPDINNSVAFKPHGALSSTNLQTNEQTVPTIDTEITRAIHQEIFDSFESVFRPNCSSRHKSEICRSFFTKSFDEKILENISYLKTELGKKLSKSSYTVGISRFMSQSSLKNLLNIRSCDAINQFCLSDSNLTDCDSSILSITSDCERSLSSFEKTSYEDFGNVYGIRIARSIQSIPTYFHVSATSSLYICGRSESSPEISSRSMSYQTAFSDFSNTSANSDIFEHDSDKTHISYLCKLQKTGQLGFSLIGLKPVRVDSVKYGSSGWESGLRTGDIIKKINGFDVLSCTQSIIGKLIRSNSDIEMHIQRERSKNLKRPKIKLESYNNKTYFAPTFIEQNNEECFETIEDINYESLFKAELSDEHETKSNRNLVSSIEFSSATIIKTQIDLFESMLKKKEKSTYCEKSQMNSLPPTAPNANKVKTRSKTHSFKRPFSCDSNEISKKESKGSFFNLRKGSSNSKLNEEVDMEEAAESNIEIYDAVCEEKNSGKMQGRNFDSDDDDYDIPNQETSVTKMDKLFSDYGKVVNNPALLGCLLKYLASHNMDYNDLLYYLVVQHYKATVQLKDFSKEAARFANEIITTFILDKSILKIDHKIDTLVILDDLKMLSNLQTIFDKSSEEIYRHCIKSNIDKIRQSIKHGLFTLEVSVGTFNFDSKMNFFNECIKTIVKNLEDKMAKESTNAVTKETKEKEQYMVEIISGVKTSLATIYYYFTKKEKDDNADSVSLLSNKHLRSTFLMKSTESLQIMTNCILDKQPIFCSKMHKKSNSHSFFRKGKSNKGHTFQENIFVFPVTCLLCEKLLWGINPQGFYCSHCQESVHRACKDHVRTNCYKDGRRFQRNLSNTAQPTDDDVNKFGGDDDSISINSYNNLNNNTETKDCLDVKETVDPDTTTNNTEIDQTIERHISSTVSTDLSSNARPGYVVSTATIYVTGSDDRSIVDQKGESLDNVSEIVHNDRQHEYSKSEVYIKNEIHNEEKKYLSPQFVPQGHVRSTILKYDQKNMSRSQSLRKSMNLKFGNDDMETRSLPRSVKRGSEAVFVQDLVPDSNAWSNDPDMMVEETFEANKELEFFSKHLTKEEDKAEYTRLLVLMEFHHKIKFTVMTLKRFDYLLIKQWPNDDTLLFKTLSLNSITPLYELIKTLDSTIELSKTTVSYSKDMAHNVHNWLVEDGESNMQKWLKYSIDLCCTNSLNLVKNTWKDYHRTDSRFFKVLNKKHNKMIMVEQLSNMRPLLFNLPLIVGKIFKDLNKFSKFKEETKIWKEIREKFKTLPTFIDEHCMPLVQLINNGTIVNTLDRTNWSSKLNTSDPYFDFILDFPKTAFHHKLFDFQEIKISNFRESGVKNKTPAIFVKEISEVYAICYDNMLVLLQKENEKYHLKQFKATDTSKMNPILVFDNLHASLTDSKSGSLFGMALMFINVAVLAQIWFPKDDVRSRWFQFMCQFKSKSPKIKIETEPLDINSTDKYIEVKEKFQNFSQFHLSFFKEENKVEEIDEKSGMFPIPTNANECIVGTSFDAINILKTCYENLSAPPNDEILYNLLALLSSMENRISNYKNQQSNQNFTSEEIESELSNMIRDEQQDISRQITPTSQNVESADDSGGEIYGQEINNTPPEINTVIVTDEENVDNENTVNNFEGENIDEDTMPISTVYKEEEDDKLSDILESNSDEDVSTFVDSYVRKIIDDAVAEINMVSSGDLDVDDEQDDQSLMQLSSALSESSA